MSLAIFDFVVAAFALLAGLATMILLALLRAQRRQLAAFHDDAEKRMVERETLARAQATLAERERIHADLHDDIGARLLGMIHSAESPEQADRALSLIHI